ncbi:hypothetical protein ACFVSN_24920, partial [Kitasatospora sp. NPDC057904]|uniref:hypothetical protein n=1 Tax=Kitasatospora sp. NPDC057904 TaxID=3346275 RepID=UPI0036DF68BA
MEAPAQEVGQIDLPRTPRTHPNRRPRARKPATGSTPAGRRASGTQEVEPIDCSYLAAGGKATPRRTTWHSSAQEVEPADFPRPAIAGKAKPHSATWHSGAQEVEPADFSYLAAGGKAKRRGTTWHSGAQEVD